MDCRSLPDGKTGRQRHSENPISGLFQYRNGKNNHSHGLRRRLRIPRDGRRPGHHPARNLSAEFGYRVRHRASGEPRLRRGMGVRQLRHHHSDGVHHLHHPRPLAPDGQCSGKHCGRNTCRKAGMWLRPSKNNRRPCIHTTATHFPNERNRRKQHEKNSIGGRCTAPRRRLASLPNRKNAPSTYRRPNSRSPRSGQHPKPLQ